MADDELLIPQVPEPKPDDSEDVSWALSTAEAMWARGDHLEGIKWVRKAAEAASEAEHDMRALELAKTAADLAAMIARRSAADPAPASSRTLPGGDPPTSSQRVPATSRSVAPAPPPAPKKPAPPPAPRASAAPVPPVVSGSGSGASAGAAKGGRSIPPAPIPLPSNSTPPPAPSSSRAAPRPVATNVKTQGPAPGKGVLSNRPPAPAKGRRKSRENLEDEARAAGVLETAPHSSVDPESALRTLGKTDEMPAVAESTRTKRRSRPDADPTVVANVKALVSSKSADEWDNSPTQSLAGDEVPSHGDRKTAHMGAAKPSARPPSIVPHDPGIQTTQAIRVVVFRDANGVHVAPAGTVISALKIDAVLVALDPNADLTAWLTQRDR